VCFRGWEDSRIVEAAVLVPGQLCGVSGERKSFAIAVRTMARDGEVSHCTNPATGKADRLRRRSASVSAGLVSEWP